MTALDLHFSASGGTWPLSMQSVDAAVPLACGPLSPTGPTGPQGPTGPTGPAYTLSEADKQELVNATIAALPVYSGQYEEITT